MEQWWKLNAAKMFHRHFIEIFLFFIFITKHHGQKFDSKNSQIYGISPHPCSRVEIYYSLIKVISRSNSATPKQMLPVNSKYALNIHYTVCVQNTSVMNVKWEMLKGCVNVTPPLSICPVVFWNHLAFERWIHFLPSVDLTCFQPLLAGPTCLWKMAPATEDKMWWAVN